MIGKEYGLIIVALVAVMFFTAGCATNPTATSVGNLTVINPPTEHTITTTGEAQTMVEPDQLVVTLEVESSGKTASQAQSANADVIDEVMKSLNANGVEDEKIKTSYYNVYEDKKGRWVCP